jgi:hypothetical protein
LELEALEDRAVPATSDLNQTPTLPDRVGLYKEYCNVDHAEQKVCIVLEILSPTVGGWAQVGFQAAYGSPAS